MGKQAETGARRTARQAALIEDARAAGFEIRDASGGGVEIVKWDGRTKGRRPLQGLVLFGNGTAIDATVDLAASKGIRSYAAMRKVLGLKPETRS